MREQHPFYLIWSGSLNFGDTPGVFSNSQFVGLLAQIPVKITFVSDNGQDARFLLQTTDVEVFDGKKHAVYWDWLPGTPLPTAVGFIDDSELIPGRPELHELLIPSSLATLGPHTLTFHVNPAVTAGLKDDFVLERIEAHNSIGARIGW